MEEDRECLICGKPLYLCSCEFRAFHNRSINFLRL